MVRWRFDTLGDHQKPTETKIEKISSDRVYVVVC